MKNYKVKLLFIAVICLLVFAFILSGCLGSASMSFEQLKTAIFEGAGTAYGNAPDP